MIVWLTAFLSISAGKFDRRTTSGNPFDQPGLRATPGQMVKIHGKSNYGCIEGAEPLNLRSKKYIVLNPQRNAYWGHPKAIEFIEKWSTTVLHRFGKKLKILDIGLPFGGPVIPRHASHQIGLDIDIALQTAPKSFGQRDANLSSSPQFGVLKVVSDRLDNGGWKYTLDSRVTSYWNQQSFQLVKMIAQDPLVSRIFINPSIRQNICQMAKVQRRANRLRVRPAPSEQIPEDLNWIRKIRFVSGHTYHFHVRLHQADKPNLAPPYAGTDWGLGCELNRGPNTYWLQQRVFYFSDDDDFGFEPKTFLQQRAKAHFCQQHPERDFCSPTKKTEDLLAEENSNKDKKCFTIKTFEGNTELFSLQKCVPLACYQLVH